ncbi:MULTISPECIES: molybdate ABC transporter substrate-binding protein [Bacillaceae]|uniref:Molybdate ABC transporter substrate-binding protein n=1 Tax=Metabacillus sediminis TaxID=3117746 RepID=A0ABZ2NBH1_9BACI|nr:molybdate ABC transporter substrate-binding protein [Bacillus sp. SJS]KZZ82661.1 molybdate ABC transporter substrate-binding protein [Bacillus sp. SJS]
MKTFMLMASMAAIIALSGCSSSAEKGKTELTVSAAASLKDVLTELQKDFNKKHPSIQVSFNYGGSGALQQQISQGAPADLFFSAAEDKFDVLQEEGKIDKQHATDLVGNEIVLITSKDSKIGAFQNLDQLKGTFAMGTPESVPAGHYAKETLSNLDLWDSLKEKVVYGKDVRQVLNYVETGNAEAGIVYKTDASASKNVKVAAVPPEGSHSAIIYPLGILKETRHPEEAEKLYTYLTSKQAMKTFQKYGFLKAEQT